MEKRADIYSLGVILYETLTGRPPFEGTKTIEVMLKHVSEQPKPPSAVEPSLGEPLDELLLKALAKEPADRHQTMAEFAEAMVGAAAAIGVTAGQLPELREGVSRPPPSLTPAPVALTASGTQTPGVRSRIWALAGVALLALVGGGVFVALQLSTGTTPGRPVEEEAAAPPGSAVPGSRAEADRPPPTAGGSSAAGARPAGPPPEAEAASTPPSEPRPSPPQAAEPATVRISLKSRPTGAAVFLGDDQLGLTPLEHEQPFGREAVEFTFRKKGHEATVEQVVPDERQTVTATLDRSRAPRQATKTKRSVFRSNR